MPLITTDKTEFPSQTENRRAWQLDTIRANQRVVALLLEDVGMGSWGAARARLKAMYKLDRDAILQPGGIFELEQLDKLNEQAD